MFTIHKHTEMWERQGSELVSALIQDLCCYLSKLALALCELQWFVEFLKESLVLSRNLKQLLRVTESIQLLTFYRDLPLNHIDAHTVCRFCRLFKLGLLVRAVPELEHRRQIADW